ncbi:MAG: hypothetical protein L6Q35_00575 [Phycisphaerales bacterium]|nr:hypothetical protein [Phycisphaerales bacterium]
MPALHDIIAPVYMAALTTLELGAAYRIAEAAWSSDPAGTVPGDDTFLAAVARITSAEWSAAGPAVLRALGSAPHAPAPGSPHDPACGAAGHLVLQAVRSASDAARANVARSAARSDAIRAKRREAGAAGAAARWQRDGKPMANAIRLPSAAPSLRSLSSQVSSAPAPAPIPERAMQSAPEGDVCAVLGEGARALLDHAVRDWRRKKALGMLEAAIARWAAAGLTSCPVAKASEMASGEHATPARVQLLIESADQAIAQARASGRRCNPVGMVIAGLGMSQASRGRPREVPLFVVQRWAESEAAAVRMLEAQSAINARIQSARTSIHQPAGREPAQGRFA